MGIQLSDLVENIVGKQEISRYEQPLLFPQCFQNPSVVDGSNLWSKALTLWSNFYLSKFSMFLPNRSLELIFHAV